MYMRITVPRVSTMEYHVACLTLLSCCLSLHAQDVYNADTMTAIRTADGPQCDPMLLAMLKGDEKTLYEGQFGPWKAPAGQLQPLRICGPRNGVYSGMVIASKAVPATASDLVRDGGSAVIPADAIRIRYPAQGRDLSSDRAAAAFGAGKQGDLQFFGLADKPYGKTIQPILMTIAIPKTATPGVYRGRLKVGAVTVPLVLTVVDVLLPDPQDMRFGVALTHSLSTSALFYGVAPFSDAHFRHIETSLGLLGQLGQNVMILPLFGHNLFGDEYGLATFAESGGKLVPDLTVLNRYVDLYIKHCGKPRIVVAWAFSPYMGQANRYPRGDRRYILGKKREALGKEVYLSVRRGGKLVAIPHRAKPLDKELWKAVFDGLKRSLAQRGVSAGALRIGYGVDGSHDHAKDIIQGLNEAAGDPGWAAHSHSYGGEGIGRRTDSGIHYTYIENPDPGVTHNPFEASGWAVDPLKPAYGTGRDYHRDGSPPYRYRFVPTYTGGRGRVPHGGLARIGLDFWMLSAEKLGATADGRVFNRYPGDRRNRLYRSATHTLTVPGPNGALPSIHFEMLRQGIQEVEMKWQLEQRMATQVAVDRIRWRIQRAEWDLANEKNAADIAKRRAGIQRMKDRDLVKAVAARDAAVDGNLARRFSQLMWGRAKARLPVPKYFFGAHRDRPGELRRGTGIPANDGKWAQRNEAFWKLAAEIMKKYPHVKHAGQESP